VEMSKEGFIVPDSALDHTKAAIECTPMHSGAHALEPKNHNRTHATYSRVFHIVLAAIANLLAPWDIGAVTCNRAHTSRSSALSALRSSAPSLSKQLTFSINRTT
jgi:hypothetical protein